jgi:CubicO group peptidase (beta-lactamase class C family)
MENGGIGMISERIRNQIADKWLDTTPGFHLRVIFKGETIADERFGVTYPIYDWASLTKMVFTHTLTMKSIENGILHEDDLVGKYLPELQKCRDLKIKHLLCHSAGLPSSINFWKTRSIDNVDIAADWRGRVLALNIGPTKRSSYTEIDFQLIGYVLEKILGSDIELHWKNLAEQLGLKKTNFRPLSRGLLGSNRIAPTEICPLREKRIQGEVHHPDVWLNNGVGWLSGLFGPMDDLETWAKGLRSAHYGSESWVVSSRTLSRFTCREVGNSSLGFMMPNLGRREGQKYYLSCGHKLSAISIGHTGFTGPMFWFDPAKDLVVLVLANRTFPSSANEKWFDFRGILHDDVVSALEDEGVINDQLTKDLRQ